MVHIKSCNNSQTRRLCQQRGNRSNRIGRPEECLCKREAANIRCPSMWHDLFFKALLRNLPHRMICSKTVGFSTNQVDVTVTPLYTGSTLPSGCRTDAYIRVESITRPLCPKAEPCCTKRSQQSCTIPTTTLLGAALHKHKEFKVRMYQRRSEKEKQHTDRFNKRIETHSISILGRDSIGRAHTWQSLALTSRI
jgi:hypothetical protein